MPWILLVVAGLLEIGWAIGLKYTALGAALCGMIFLAEPATPARVLFLGLLFVPIIGLKLTAA